MTIDINISILLALSAVAVAAAVAAAMAALWRTRAIRREARDAHAAAAVMALRVDAMEKTLSECVARIDELLAERSNPAATSSRPGLREAVALSRHGASTEELISTCRIGRSEARLIQMLYGAAREASTPTTSADMH